MKDKSKQDERLFTVRVPAEKEDFFMSWSPHVDNEHFHIWTNCEPLAKILVVIAHQNKIDYVLFPWSIQIKLPARLVPFRLPFRKAYSITDEERQRRREWGKKIARKKGQKLK